MLILEVADGPGAAAWSGRVFGWLGHEVVAVRPPDRPLAGDPAWSAAALYLDEGKRIETLDYRRADGRAALAGLAGPADIIVTDASPADVTGHRLFDLGGSGAVVVSITPYGLDGPYRDWVATPATLLAHGGYTDLMGDPGRPPLTMPGNYPLYQAGSVATFAGLAARWGTGRSGAGRSGPPGRTTVTISVLEVVAAAHQFTDIMWTAYGMVRNRHGNRFEGAYPIGLWPCRDGWYSLVVLEQMWFRFALMVSRPDVAEDHELALNANRAADPDATDAVFVPELSGWDRRRIFREAQETWRVAAGHLMSLDELLADEHLAARGFWRPPTDARPVHRPGSPIRYVPGPAPAPVSEPGPADGLGSADGRVTPSADRSTPVRPDDPSGAAVAGAPASRPLEGIRVLELTDYWAGPLAGRNLGDLGADVILVERAAGRPPRNALFDKLNRNKRSLAVDLKSAGGRSLFLDLVRRSDVVLDNFSTRTMPGLGLGYDDLRSAHPGIIYAAVSGFGTDGPQADYVAAGPNVEPMTGLTAVMGYSESEPRVTSKGILDPIAGNLATAAILGALHQRAETGSGGLVELALQECGICFLGEVFVDWQRSGRRPAPAGADADRAPWGVYPCRGDDEWIAVTVTDEAAWVALCAEAGRGWEDDPRFGDAAARVADRTALDAEVAAWTAGRDKRELAAALQARRVAAAPVLRTPEWMADPALVGAGFFSTLPNRDLPVLHADGLAPVIDGNRDYGPWRPAPAPGEHSADILHGLLGLDRATVDGLTRRGIVSVPDPAAPTATGDPTPNAEDRREVTT